MVIPKDTPKHWLTAWAGIPDPIAVVLATILVRIMRQVSRCDLPVISRVQPITGVLEDRPICGVLRKCSRMEHQSLPIVE